MQTDHRLRIADARDLSWIDDNSIDLVVTSPPYPMIEMWDELFLRMQPDVRGAMDRGDGQAVLFAAGLLAAAAADASGQIDEHPHVGFVAFEFMCRTPSPGCGEHG